MKSCYSSQSRVHLGNFSCIRTKSFFLNFAVLGKRKELVSTGQSNCYALPNQPKGLNYSPPALPSPYTFHHTTYAFLYSTKKAMCSLHRNVVSVSIATESTAASLNYSTANNVKLAIRLTQKC